MRYWNAKKILRGKEVPVVVYTMAKVASTSIYRSILSKTSIPTFHIHSLDSEKIVESIELCKENDLVPDSRSPGDLIYAKIKRDAPIKIITCVREPIARNLSAFFEAFQFHTQCNPRTWKGETQDLEDIFYNKMNHDLPIQWFDDEFLRMLGFDIYSIPFQTNKKYQLYKYNNIEILLLRTDLANTEKEKIINLFIEPNKIFLNNYNEGKNKIYATLYRDFRNEISLKYSYQEKLLQSKYTQHFYSHKEIDSLYKKYSKNK